MRKRFLSALSGFFLINAPASFLHAQGNSGGVRVIEPGQPQVVIHATVGDAIAAQHANGRPGGGSTSANLSYHGGVGGVGVETAPKVYLVFWGAQWNSNDPSGEAGGLGAFFSAGGGSYWLESVSPH